MTSERKEQNLPIRILLLEENKAAQDRIGNLLRQQNWEVIPSACTRDALSLLANTIPDIALIDITHSQDDCLKFAGELRRRLPDRGIIILAEEDTETLGKKAEEADADYFLSKPVSPATLTITVRRLTELQQQRTRVIYLEKQLRQSVQEQVFPDIVTHSDSMKAVMRLVEKISQRDLSVLIHGESGTGKELVARAVHHVSPRASGPFIELNCAALPPNLVESELFGHEKGAFTGAVNSRAGKIEQAQGGTLLLDEIGEMPLEIQPKLLRALQDKRVTRVGGKASIEVDFRLISATNRDLVEEVKEGRFREDLFYRIAVFPIKLPPLRQRMEDIDLLLAHFLQQEGIKNPQITREARDILHSYRWPGNIRELRNFAQAIPLYAESGVIDADNVRAWFGARLGEHGPTLEEKYGNAGIGGEDPLRPVRKLEEVERQEILHALRYYQGNVAEASIALGMGRATLYKYIKKHDIDTDALA